MSTDSASNKIPEEALGAFLDGVLAELKTPSDPAMLTQVRAIFRKRIPLNLRSYAAAILILRAAGLSHPQSLKSSPSTTSKTEREAPEARRDGIAMVPLFVSMGKRQRLRPQELRSLISEKTGILTSDLGRVHLFDNYSFIDIPETEATRIIEAVNGATIRGKPIEIKPAKKRVMSAKESDGDNTN
ncbi:MAG: DbpA RNA binding domain-containing protein [Spirochaetaceae bacterium]|nr:DbpA RNA binding domain-containing protein [Spirochaetaceae bacterium]